MEQKTSEVVLRPEASPDINPHLKSILNTGLTITHYEFSRKNTIHNPEVERFEDALGIIEASIQEHDPSEDGLKFYAVRTEYYDQKRGLYIIKLAPEGAINRHQLLKDGSPSLDFSNSETVDECQISIAPFSEYQTGQKIEADKILSIVGYYIDFSTSRINFQDEKLQFSPRVAGIGFKLYRDNKARCYLKSYVGSIDFDSKDYLNIKDGHTVSQTCSYLSTLGLKDPVDNLL